MTNDKATLSIDFLVGFTIFLIAFVWVLSMVPGLLIGLQGYTIDYDAVAYRTSVILVEDPGQITEQNLTDPWESLPATYVARFGLAVSRETPNILSDAKVDRFFCKTVFSYPTDYQNKAIFGDYHYGFNISLRDGTVSRSIGDVTPKDTSYPSNYGYMRRLVKIKGASSATINTSTINTYTLNNSYPNVKSHTFSILINNSRLYSDMANPAYRIDPVTDKTIINFTGLNSTMSDPNSNINLTSITINGVKYSSSIPETRVLIEGNNKTLPQNVTAKNISIAFSPVFFQGVQAGIFDPSSYKPVFVNLTFDLTSNSTFLNNTWSTPFNYNYTTAQSPQLRDAVFEVAVWSGPVTESAVVNSPVALFTGTPTSGFRPLDVQFTDASTNSPTSWAWTFGDGGTSTLKNPLYTYANAGTYTVVLTATNAGGSNTLTRTNYITVNLPPPHTITASASGSGVLSPSGAVTVPDGASQSFTVDPDPGKNIISVVVDGVALPGFPMGNNAVYTHTFTNVIADHTIVATFAV
jgi:PKD repeat protein